LEQVIYTNFIIDIIGYAVNRRFLQYSVLTAVSPGSSGAG